MDRQLSTGVIGGTLDTTALDIMVRTLLASRRPDRHPDSIGLTTALMTPNITPTDVMLACKDDVSLKFGVQVMEVGVLAYSPRAVAVAFTGRPVAGGRAETTEQRKEREFEEQRQREAAQRRITSSPARFDRDPVWLLWPWGRRLGDNWRGVDYMMNNLAVGIANMLNGLWSGAIYPLQLAAQQAGESVGMNDLAVVRRAIATNINLAVRYSHDGAPTT